MLSVYSSQMEQRWKQQQSFIPTKPLKKHIFYLSSANIICVGGRIYHRFERGIPSPVRGLYDVLLGDVWWGVLTCSSCVVITCNLKQQRLLLPLFTGTILERVSIKFLNELIRWFYASAAILRYYFHIAARTFEACVAVCNHVKLFRPRKSRDKQLLLSRLFRLRLVFLWLAL